MVPKENHVGKFPANYCVKMIGDSSKSGTCNKLGRLSDKNLNRQKNGLGPVSLNLLRS
jgi:hypothetical protein